jgi:hypothetical protein
MAMLTGILAKRRLMFGVSNWNNEAVGRKWHL